MRASEAFDLVAVLNTDRNDYRAPESRGTVLKLLVTQNLTGLVKDLCAQCSFAPFGKPPGFQPAAAASISYSLSVLTSHPAIEDILRTRGKRARIGKQVDIGIITELNRYSTLKIPPPTGNTTHRNVTLWEDSGSKLTTLAGDLNVPHHDLARLCLTYALSVQPDRDVPGYEDLQREMLAELDRVWKLFQGNAFCLESILDRLLDPPKGRWDGRTGRGVIPLSLPDH